MNDPQRWRRAADLATRASSMPADELPAFLEKECGRHPDYVNLREEVEALLASRSLRADEPTEAEHRPVKISHRIDRIGPYHLDYPLGEGGMGEVFLAHQTAPIERDVAIKLIRASVHGKHSHRFELERRTLARMSHPYIAQVYEAGDTDEGVPYLVMELIDGKQIDTYCDRARLSIEARLRLFCAVCEGIHYAHQKGVLHRDVKPANILITEVQGEPIPKIIDFGIAKALDEDPSDIRHLTKTGGFVGTPAYLSPESVISPGSDDVDIRTDVYALGILLYGLIVGELPFEGDTKSWIEIFRQVSEEDPPSPSSRFASLESPRRHQLAARRGLASGQALGKRVVGDLDAIVLMAVARDREDRYGSAAQLAADVQRHLEDVPVRARPRSRWYETRRYVRRHRAGVFTSVVVIVTLVIGMVARTIEANRADREAVAARQAQTETKEVVDFLVDLFETSDPSRSLGDSITARELLEEGAIRLRRDLADQPRTRARLLDTVGVVFERLGLFDESSKLLEEALAEREKLDPRSLAVAETLKNLGLVRWQQGELDEARNLYSRSLEIRQRELGGDHPLVADVFDDLGMVHELEADFEQAERLLNRALAVREAHHGHDSEQVAETLAHLAIAKQDQGQYKRAETLSKRVLEIRERIHGQLHPEVARALNSLALAIASQDRDAEAEPLLRRSLEIRKSVLGPEHSEVGQVLNNLGNVLMALDRHEEALELIERALELWEIALGPTHTRVGIAVYNLADYHFEKGELGRAEPMLRRAKNIFIESRGADHPHVAFATKRLADLLRDTGRLEESEELYRRAFEIRSARMPRDHPQLVMTARELAALLRLRGKEREAIALEEQYPEEH